MINTDNSIKVEIMRLGGKKLHSILENLLNIAKPGVSLIDIENQAQRHIKTQGGSPSFMTVDGYHWATCLCVNDEVVHGIPRSYILKESDLLTIDIGLLYQGFHTDTAKTIIISQTPQKNIIQYPFLISFLGVGEKTLEAAISKVLPGNRIGHISEAIQQNIEKAGFSVVRSLVGHGIGRQLHEDIQIPGFLNGSIESTEILKTGMTIAIEVIYAQGKGSVVYANNDGWTISTRDQTFSAVFEHTVVVTSNGVEILT